MKKLVFLHTAASQVEVFEALAVEMGGGQGFAFESIVDGSLLADVADRGGVDAELEARIEARVVEAKSVGAGLVLCTCSSIGGAAEAAGGRCGVRVQRVDRAMVEAAVEAGERIVVAATLASTFEASSGLVRSVAAEAGRVVELEEVLVDGAWELLSGGDPDGYLAAVAAMLEREGGQADVVVLAQASMAGAAGLAGEVGALVLSSPEPGVRRAVESLLE